MDDWRNTQYENRDYGHGAPPATSSEGDDWKFVGGTIALVVLAVGSVVGLVLSLL